MSVGGTSRRVFAFAIAALVGALSALTTGAGSAAAAPRVPIATDPPPAPAPPVPFDPGALLAAINDYAALLSIFTGGHRAQPGLGNVAPAAPAPAVPAPAPVPAPTEPYPMLPGLG